MTVTNEILNQLRHRSESVDLDFKQAHYRFIGAGEQEKSELLKDILALANSWREGTGYILIGFKDRTPEPAEVIGISETDHIDDAQIQQFVNSKVGSFLNFRYEEMMYEGKRIAVISIPQQQRPFSIATQYGKVRSNIVYVRRGSATVEAAPTEVIRMGNAEARPTVSEISVELLNRSNEPQMLDQTLRFLTFGVLPDFSRPYSGRDITTIIGADFSTNSSYYRDLANYAAIVLGSIELKFKIRNQSNFSLRDVKLELHVATPDVKYKFIEKARFPRMPSQSNGMGAYFRPPSPVNPRAFHAESRGKHQICFARIDSVLPGEDFISEPVLLQLKTSGNVSIEVRMLAEQLPTPLSQIFNFSVTGEQEHHNKDSLLQLAQGVIG